MNSYVAINHAERLCGRCRIRSAALQQLYPAKDRCQRRPQLVREYGEKFVFHPIRRFSLLPSLLLARHQTAQLQLASRQCVTGIGALDVVPHLVPNSHESVEEFHIGRLNLRTEEFHDSEHLLVSDDRKRGAGQQAELRSNGPARKIGIIANTQDPGGLICCPDAPRQPNTLRKIEARALPHKLRQVVVFTPARGEPQRLRPCFHVPEDSDLPVERTTDRSQCLRQNKL